MGEHFGNTWEKWEDQEYLYVIAFFATLFPTLEHLKFVISFSLCKHQRLSNGRRTSAQKRLLPPRTWDSTHLYNVTYFGILNPKPTCAKTSCRQNQDWT